jgi:preprotein translocase subunit SecA
MLNKSIETAQKRVEQRNYTMRKHTLEYDDVMNKQRQEIYSFRNDILNLEDIEPLAVEVIESVCNLGAERFFQTHADERGWDPEGYRQWLLHLFPVTFEPQEIDQDHLDAEQIERFTSNKVVQAFKDKLIRENLKVPAHLIAQGEPPKPAHNAVRNLMIRKTDQMWQEHLLRMDHLRTDVTLRAVGQRDPLTEFKHEAFALFDELSRNLRTEIARSVFRFEIITPQQTLQQLLQAGLRLETNRSLFADLQKVQLDAAPFQTEGDEQEEEEEQEENQENQQDRQEPENDDHGEPVSAGPRIGRNELCPCGSGKKYKKCCQTEAV